MPPVTGTGQDCFTYYNFMAWLIQMDDEELYILQCFMFYEFAPEDVNSFHRH